MDLHRRRATMQQMTCPTCDKRFPLEPACAMPFCSVRCRQIDLGRWFNEEIGFPVEPHEADLEVDEGFTN